MELEIFRIVSIDFRIEIIVGILLKLQLKEFFFSGHPL